MCEMGTTKNQTMESYVCYSETKYLLDRRCYIYVLAENVEVEFIKQRILREMKIEHMKQTTIYTTSQWGECR